MSIADAEAQDAETLKVLRTPADITQFLIDRWSADEGDSLDALDMLVHDVKGNEAARINNDGVERQVAFLVDSLGAEALVNTLAGELY